MNSINMRIMSGQTNLFNVILICEVMFSYSICMAASCLSHALIVDGGF